MKPSFALNFTDDGIQLLHRTGKGWVTIGETPFAAPDLDDALDYLRKTALGLEPAGFTTKLVIPNSQIRYIEVDAPGPDDDSRRVQIAAALEERTPLKADEIAFDWSGKGKTVKVAALDKETLAQAEGFAVAHRFNPVGFVAIPEDGEFSGEPWFGQAEAAGASPVDRDKSAIRIVARDILRAEPQPAKADPVPDLVPEAVPEAVAEAVEVSVAAADPVVDMPDAAPAVTLAVQPEPDVSPAPDATPDAVDDAVAGIEDTPADASVSVLAEFLAADPLPASAAPKAPDEAEEAPFAHVAENPAFPEEDLDAPDIPASSPAVGERWLASSDPLDDPGVADDLPPAPSSAAMVAFASRRGAEAPSRAPVLGSAERPDPAALARAARGKPVEELPPMPRPPQASARPAAIGGLRGGMAKGIGALVTSSAIPGSKKVKAKPGPLPMPAARPQMGATVVPSDAARSLTRPGGTFGTRPAKSDRSRTVLFLSLVAVLLLCLALIAAWSSFYLASRNAPTGSETTATASVETSIDTSVEAPADLPAVEDEMLADGEDPTAEGVVLTDPGLTDPEVINPGLIDPEPVETAAADVPDPPADPLVDVPADPPADVPAAVPEAAPATDVASDSPEAQSPPVNQDEIFLAAADSPPPALDALSLPSPEAAADALPAPQMPPPPFGTVYAFDENGLLIPTAEGIVSPEGVLLVAGKPPLVPPSRSEIASAAAAAAAAVPPAEPAVAPAAPERGALVEALPVGSEPATPEAAVAAEPAAQPNPDLADRRPKARPEGLAPGLAPAPGEPAPDDAALATEPGVQVASLRPRARPKSIFAAGARAETEAASLVAQPAIAPFEDTTAQLAAAAAAEAANPSVVAISRRPSARPKDFSGAVEAAVAAAIRTPEPAAEPEAPPEKAAKKAPAPDIKPEEQDEIDEPELASAPAPKIPTKASVAKNATFKNALNLSKINLIGVYGTQSKRYALIRQSNGKYKKVKIGDKIDGGRIEAITQNEVRYQKGGRLITLKMPKG